MRLDGEAAWVDPERCAMLVFCMNKGESHLFTQLVLEPVGTELDNVCGLFPRHVAVKIVEDRGVGWVLTSHDARFGNECRCGKKESMDVVDR